MCIRDRSLEQGRNYFAENPDALFPLVFGKILPDGRSYNANYWIALPAGFPMSGRSFPLVIELHGAGWLGHKISFKRRAGASDPVFTVTPIDMESPWKIDFLNAYLDELIAMLPIDTDRVYLQGHSLGGEATWELSLIHIFLSATARPRGRSPDGTRAGPTSRFPMRGRQRRAQSQPTLPRFISAVSLSARASGRAAPANWPALDRGPRLTQMCIRDRQRTAPSR